MKKTAEQQPFQSDAWVLGTFGIYNLSMIRKIYNQHWVMEAQSANKNRPITDRISGKNKVLAEDKMLEEAFADKATIEAGGIPETLQNQRLGQEALKRAGIEPHSVFSTQTELESILLNHGFSRI